MTPGVTAGHWIAEGVRPALPSPAEWRQQL